MNNINPSVEVIKQEILNILEEKKAEDISTVKLDEGKNHIADYMIFASGSSSKRISSIAKFVSLHLKNEFNIASQIEGLANANWVLIDVGNIIVHLFLPEKRVEFDFG